MVKIGQYVEKGQPLMTVFGKLDNWEQFLTFGEPTTPVMVHEIIKP
jgi:hypothetical protein